MITLDWIRKARSKGCPLLAISTSEPAGLIKDILWWTRDMDIEAYDWNCASGICGDNGITSPDALLAWCTSAPSNALVVAWWQLEYWQDAIVRQGLANLREMFRSDGRTLILVSRSMSVPASMHADFLIREEPLPDGDALQGVLDSIKSDAQLTQDMDESAIIDALRGMTLFEAEQHLAMALDREQGIDIGVLWQSKVELINAAPGLTCWQGGETESDVKGLDALVDELHAMRDGRKPVRLVVWIDESEDVLAGTVGDTSGISQYYEGTLAKHMVDSDARSLLLAGHPGTGKSQSAKMAGSVFNCLVIALDLGGCKGSLVGQSEAQLAHALAVERAVVGHRPGATLWIWTSNNPEAISSKLRSRQRGEYFFDLPEESEALAIWSYHRAKYEISPGDSFPRDCEHWTGREIERCCAIAWEYRWTLAQAGERIVPIRKSQAVQIDERRKKASGKFLNPAQGGVFEVEVSKGRKVQV